MSKHKKYLVILLFIIVGFIAVMSYGIYRLGWQGDFIFKATRFVPYPAVIVDWEFISYRAFLDELGAVERYWRASGSGRPAAEAAPEPDEISRRLLEKLIEQKMVQIWARKHQLAVSADELAAEWERFLKNPESKNEVDVFLNKTYGWNEEKFKNKVLASWLLQEKVKLALARQIGRDEEGSKARAEEIYQKIKPDGSNFAAVAKAESDDKLSADAGGAMGYIGQEQFEPAAAAAIFKMKIGRFSKPLRFSGGYQIVKVEDILYNNYNQPIKADLRQILVKTFDFDQWLEQQKRAVKIWRLIPIAVSD